MGDEDSAAAGVAGVAGVLQVKEGGGKERGAREGGRRSGVSKEANRNGGGRIETTWRGSPDDREI